MRAQFALTYQQNQIN